MVPVALRAPSTMPAPQPCSVLIPCFEVTNSETAGFKKVHGRRRMRYARGDGFFQLIGRPEMKGEFGVERLDPHFLKEVLGVPYISTTEDIANVVEAYHQKKHRNQLPSQIKELEAKPVQKTTPV
jgi:hypothetical protein